MAPIVESLPQSNNLTNESAFAGVDSNMRFLGDQLMQMQKEKKFSPLGCVQWPVFAHLSKSMTLQSDIGLWMRLSNENEIPPLSNLSPHAINDIENVENQNFWRTFFQSELTIDSNQTHISVNNINTGGYVLVYAADSRYSHGLKRTLDAKIVLAESHKRIISTLLILPPKLNAKVKERGLWVVRPQSEESVLAVPAAMLADAKLPTPYGAWTDGLVVMELDESHFETAQWTITKLKKQFSPVMLFMQSGNGVKRECGEKEPK